MLKRTRKNYLKGSHHHGGYQFPIDQFLHSRVSQPWAEVHSELSQEFDRRTYSGYSFWQNLNWHVEQNCWIGAKTGTIYANSRWTINCPVSGFYVHPFTGILCYAEPPVRSKRREDLSEIKLADGSWYSNEEVGHVKRRFRAWFYHWTETTISVSRKYLDAGQIQTYRLEGKPVEQDEIGFFIWKESSHDEHHKRSANRKDMHWIRNYISEKVNREK